MIVTPPPAPPHARLWGPQIAGSLRLFIQYIRLHSEVVPTIRTVGRNPTIRRGTYFSSTSLL